MSAVSAGPKANGFRAWLVDLDGTLYWQLPVRIAMACELSLFGGRHLPVIARFRKEQEALRHEDFLCECPYQEQLRRTAAAVGADVCDIGKAVSLWMEQRPGKWLWLWRRRGLLAEIAAFRAAGGRTALVSDYPASRKLAALQAAELFDVVVACGESGGPRQLKPSPEGYLVAAERLGVTAENCLVIGDRDDADGAAAAAAGMAYRNIRKRRRLQRPVACMARD